MRKPVTVSTLIFTLALFSAHHARATTDSASVPDGPFSAVVPAASPAGFVTPEQCWRGWLARNHMLEGINRKANGDVIFVVKASDVVQVSPGAPEWVTARNALAGQLHLKALGKISRFIRQRLSGSARADWLKAGDTPPPLVAEIADRISLTERARHLAGLKLDAEIRKFDPTWKGEGKTDAQKRQIAVELSQSYREAIKADSELLTGGATTVIQCEGPARSDGTATAGKYEVLVGVVWSPRLLRIARIIANPELALQPGKDRRSLARRFAQFDRRNPNWMAMTLGSRVWTDENGEMVVVGFGAAPATSIKSIDEGRARIDAVAAITRFASESIATTDVKSGAFAFSRMKDGSTRALDATAFEQHIKSVMKSITLRGAYKITEWRGKHPVTGAPMHVVAYAWKPSTNRSATDAEKLFLPRSSGNQATGKAENPVPQLLGPARPGAFSPVTDY